MASTHYASPDQLPVRGIVHAPLLEPATQPVAYPCDAAQEEGAASEHPAEPSQQQTAWGSRGHLPGARTLSHRLWLCSARTGNTQRAAHDTHNERGEACKAAAVRSPKLKSSTGGPPGATAHMSESHLAHAWLNRLPACVRRGLPAPALRAHWCAPLAATAVTQLAASRRAASVRAAAVDRERSMMGLGLSAAIVGPAQPAGCCARRVLRPRAAPQDVAMALVLCVWGLQLLAASSTGLRCCSQTTESWASAAFCHVLAVLMFCWAPRAPCTGTGPMGHWTSGEHRP